MKPQRSTLRTASAIFLLVFLHGAAMPGGGTAAAQTARPGEGPEVATPIEISAETINGELRCRPPRARIPAADRLELRVANQSRRPVTFAAGKFFDASEILESGGFTVEVINGAFIVAPRSTVWVRLRSPTPGEYYYSCYEPGQIPTPQTSGFLIVVPAAN